MHSDGIVASIGDTDLDRGQAFPADQIIVIRHAQKPTDRPKRIVIRRDGTDNAESLTVWGGRWKEEGAGW
jgi:hypothetical protein